MPRQPRLHIPGLIHHVMGRGVEGCTIFRDEHDREAFLKRLADGIGKPGGPRLYAWALMSNHFHLLLRSGEENLSSIMRRLLTGHAVSHNLRHKRKGHLFQNRYKSIIVEEEPYFLELVRYIHLNPVRCGIVKSAEDLARHPYTGHAVIMGQRHYDAQDVAAVLCRFSDKRKKSIANYGSFVADGLHQGRREELCGGGLVRSCGGIAALMARSPEERELSDERILGSGDFVESVLLDSEHCGMAGKPSIDDILQEVTQKSGINREQILGPSRERKVSSARKEFFSAAHEEAGASLSLLGRLAGRSHVAVKKAIEEMKAGRTME
jgi:REP element-mobilizing transposase RayT